VRVADVARPRRSTGCARCGWRCGHRASGPAGR
jgi:hypothetical protein